jgi:hypothetical protein
MDPKELSGLVSRLKAIIAEIEAVISAPKKLSKEEYLAKSDDEREAYDKEQMEEEPEKEEEKELGQRG